MKNKDLIKGIKERRGEKQGMLQIVKWVWDNSEMGLKDSKNFVDSN